MPGSIAEAGDPKPGAAVKIAIWQRQNLYLEHIRSDHRIFSQDLPPMVYENRTRVGARGHLPFKGKCDCGLA